MKKVLLIMVFGLISFNTFSQCNLIIKTIESLNNEKFDTLFVCENADKYYIDDFSKINIRKKLKKYIPNKIIDSILTIMKNRKIPYNFKDSCKVSYIHFFPNEELSKRYEENKEYKQKLYGNSLKCKWMVYTLSYPIYYKNYVIIDCCETAYLLFSSHKMLLLKRTKTGWEIIETILTGVS